MGASRKRWAGHWLDRRAGIDKMQQSCNTTSGDDLTSPRPPKPSPLQGHSRTPSRALGLGMVVRLQWVGPEDSFAIAAFHMPKPRPPTAKDLPFPAISCQKPANRTPPRRPQAAFSACDDVNETKTSSRSGSSVRRSRICTPAARTAAITCSTPASRVLKATARSPVGRRRAS